MRSARPLVTVALALALTSTACSDDPFNPTLADVTARLATYNTFLREVSGETLGLFPPSDPRCRADAIAAELQKPDQSYDLVGLQETFDTALIQKLGSTLQKIYPHQTLSQPAPCATPDGQCRITSGGLSLLGGRRTRVESPAIATFTACDSADGDDCLAAKGMVLSRAFIGADAEGGSDTGLFLNIVTLHLDSGTNDASKAARASQLDQLHAFLEDNICANPDRRPWTTVVLGDFNVPNSVPPPDPGNAEYEDTVARLRTTCASEVKDAYLAARGGWELGDAEAGTTTCEGGRLLPTCTPPAPLSRRIDYLWILNPGASDGGRSVAVVESAQTKPFDTGACQPKNLSDHKLVEATLRLQLTAQ